MSPSLLRPPPEFSKEHEEEFRRLGNPMPMMFEWYKNVALVAIDMASIDKDQPSVKTLPPVQEAILRGLLYRCARLMLSILRVGRGGAGGETIAILVRCVGESALTLQWVCANAEEGFSHYLASGLRTDLYLRELVTNNVQGREGSALPIETRILDSIERCFAAAGVTETAVRESSSIPNLEVMCSQLGYGDRLYVGLQRMGSHAVHGTWTDLLLHYVEEDRDGMFRLRDSDESATDYIQLLLPSILVLDALGAYVTFLIQDASLRSEMHRVLSERKHAILELNNARPEDFLLPDAMGEP